ncbi:hypothetical protein QQF64_019456 [Cirrhinus molitorella]|uniref:Uncharacterized protein n=1 Tax=Cirrhinus molitorella TaxID=172907 RepID=A0ABR3LFM2_9TELE
MSEEQGKDSPSEKSLSEKDGVQHEKPDTNIQKCHKKFRENLLQDLDNKVITFLKNELENFMKILNMESTQCFDRDKDDMCRIKDAALDLTLYFLREMKEDEAADTLEGKSFVNID